MIRLLYDIVIELLGIFCFFIKFVIIELNFCSDLLVFLLDLYKFVVYCEIKNVVGMSIFFYKY